MLTWKPPQTGKGLIKVNGKPLSLIEPQTLRFKLYEPVRTQSPFRAVPDITEEFGFQAELTPPSQFLILGLDKFQNVDIRVRVTGGGHSSQIYAIRMFIYRLSRRVPSRSLASTTSRTSS